MPQSAEPAACQVKKEAALAPAPARWRIAFSPRFSTKWTVYAIMSLFIYLF